MASAHAPTASLYRMVTDEHICPFGLKSRDLLRRNGYDIEDHRLETRAQTDAFMDAHEVSTTPQTFIGGERIGGYDDLLEYFGEDANDDEGPTYRPVIAIFATAFLMALAAASASAGAIAPVRTVEWFVAFSMCLLAVQKLRDLESFSNRFITYDLLGMRVVRYAYVYPFIELLAGVCMIAGVLISVAAPAALFIGSVGAVSVFKAVWLDGRELQCACVGGDGNVPLGFLSLTENLMMVAMALWMVVR